VRPLSIGHVIKRGRDDTQHARQRYHCQACRRDFDDLTGTIFAHHHRPLRVWVLCLYLMGLNLSNHQIAQELDLSAGDAHEMTSQLRAGIVALKPNPTLSGAVECDEVYLVAGHKGRPEAVKKRAKAETPPTEGRTRARHIGDGEAARLRHAGARRSSRHPDAP